MVIISNNILIIGATIFLGVIAILVTLWLVRRRNKKRDQELASLNSEQIKPIDYTKLPNKKDIAQYEEVLNDFNNAERLFAESRGEEDPNKILWDIAKSKSVESYPVRLDSIPRKRSDVISNVIGDIKDLHTKDPNKYMNQLRHIPPSNKIKKNNLFRNLKGGK